MFKILKQSKKTNARLGVLKTARGQIKTPFFMPDATRGLVKLHNTDELKKAGIGSLVVNAYHLLLEPKMEVIKKAGGVHKFMDWQKPLLCDSGGYQVFSLIHKNKNMGRVTDDKVVFRSPLDGSPIELTPEKSIQIQFDLGVDMMICLDDCPPNDFNKKEIKKAVERTIKWAERCACEYESQVKKRRGNKIRGLTPLKGVKPLSNNTPLIRGDKGGYYRPLIFSVIQGGPYLDLRKRCVEGLMRVAPKIGWDGYGFGARPVDKEGKFLMEVLKYTADLIPKNSLRFALGVGTPEDIRRCAAMGWDMFDCVIPTREGRHGRLFFWKKNNKLQITNYKLQINSKIKNSNFYNTINITNAKLAKDFSPINPDSKLPELRNYTKAYLHHLFKIKEPLGQRLASLNNLEFYMDLMGKIRGGIKS